MSSLGRNDVTISVDFVVIEQFAYLYMIKQKHPVVSLLCEKFGES